MPVHEPSRDRGDGWRELESAGEPVGTLAGSGRESLPSAPSADGTAGVDSNLRNSPRGGATTADGERQHGAPARRTQGGAGRHRSRSSSPGHGGSWARWSGTAAPGADGTGAGGPVARAAGGPPARGGRAGSGRGHRRWALRAGAGLGARAGVLVAETWGRGRKVGAAGGTADGTMVRWRGWGREERVQVPGERETFQAGGAPRRKHVPPDLHERRRDQLKSWYTFKGSSPSLCGAHASESPSPDGDLNRVVPVLGP
jgi:hypothetical protein